MPFSQIGFSSRKTVVENSIQLKLSGEILKLIVWLASYPRSGNTLLRSRLLKCFGLNTYSLYDDTTDIGAGPELSSVVGHVSHGLNKRKFYRRRRLQKYLFRSKRTIYRGMMARRSMSCAMAGRRWFPDYHYNRNSFPAGPFSLRDVVLGDCMFGSWSDHIEAWAPKTQPQDFAAAL